MIVECWRWRCVQDLSGRAVGVPGELKGLAQVHAEFGR